MADIAANLPANVLSGAVCLGGVPWIGPVAPKIASPELLAALGGLLEEKDVLASARASLVFSDLLFNDPKAIDWDIRCKWNGMATFQLPIHRQLLFGRQHDPTKLFELGASNFPMLVVHGRNDKHLQVEPVVSEMKPVFKNLEVHIIEKGGSHAVHLENESEVMKCILAFARKVHV